MKPHISLSSGNDYLERREKLVRLPADRTDADICSGDALVHVAVDGLR
jgi:hypothetical protein